MKVGVLGLQGAFIEHIEKFSNINVESVIVKNNNDFDKIDSLVIPGGESTVILKLLRDNNLIDRLNQFIHQERKVVMGVCAGLIVLADPEINGLNIEIERNYYGSHNESFIDDNKFQNKLIKGMFIRAPKIKELKSDDILVISTNTNDEITGIKQNNVIGFTFHPELSNDFDIYHYFISLQKKFLSKIIF